MAVLKRVKLFVDHRIKLNLNEIDDETFAGLKERFKYGNPEYYKIKATRGFVSNGVLPYFTSYEIMPKYITFSRGTINIIRKFLKLQGYDVEVIDNRLFKPLDKPFIDHSTYQLRDYQEKNVAHLKFFQQGLMRGVCGCGKTEVGSEVVRQLSQWTLIIVHKKRLLVQWRKRIAKRFGIDMNDIGIWGDGTKEIKPITIGLVQSVIKDVDKLRDKFGAIIVDECHHAPAETFTEIIDSFPAAYRIGLSATMERKDGKHVLMYDAFGNIVTEVTKEMLMERELIHDAEIIIVPTEFKCEEYYYKSKKKGYTYLVQKMILDKDRNRLIYSYLNKELNDNHYCIVLSDRVRFCKNWKKWLEQKDIVAKLLIGENDAESEEALDLLEEELLHCVIGTTVADEGLDAPILDRGFGTTPTALHPSRLIQQVGRIERISNNKQDAKYYYFWDKWIGGFEEHPRAIMKKFNNVSIILPDGTKEILKKNGKKGIMWTRLMPIIYST